MRLVPTLLTLLALCGCGGGPDAEVLQKDVVARLSEALPEGAVSMASFERRGSQVDTKAPGDESRRIVYFDAQLKLERDLDFGAWDAPGVAGLVSALGSGPKGIVGIRSGGNKAGDVLFAHGTALYKHMPESDSWVAAASGSYRPAEAPSYAASEPEQGPAALLEAMRTVIGSMPKDASPEQVAVIEQELAAAQATVQARLARLKDGYAVAAGPEHGQYLRFAQALFDASGIGAVTLVTRGGEDNLELLRAGKVSVALAQADAALAAYEGSGPFRDRGPHSVLRAVGSLYPEPVHVIVRADTPFTTLAQLKGRRVAVGVPGSASRRTALSVLEAHGLSLASIKPLDLPLHDALVGLQRGEVDAAIQVIGVPSDSIRDAMASLPLRLLPLSERAIASLSASGTGLFAHTILPASYASLEKAVPTVATAALLLVGTDLSTAEVGKLTRLVYEKGRDFAARGSAQGLQVSVSNARQGLTVPLHTAAAQALDLITVVPAEAAPSGPN